MASGNGPRWEGYPLGTFLMLKFCCGTGVPLAWFYRRAALRFAVTLLDKLSGKF